MERGKGILRVGEISFMGILLYLGLTLCYKSIEVYWIGYCPHGIVPNFLFVRHLLLVGGFSVPLMGTLFGVMIPYRTLIHSVRFPQLLLVVGSVPCLLVLLTILLAQFDPFFQRITLHVRLVIGLCITAWCQYNIVRYVSRHHQRPLEMAT